MTMTMMMLYLLSPSSPVACRLVMPRHQQVIADTKTAQGSVRNPNIVLVLGFLFFVLSCGIESSFQSQSFTFALCGPHKMTAQQVELAPH